MRDIQFITSDRNYCEIQLPEKRLLVRASLTKLLGLFEPGIFLPVGRHAAVRAGAIDYLDLETGLLHVGTNSLPFSWRRLKSDIFERHCLLK